MLSPGPGAEQAVTALTDPLDRPWPLAQQVLLCMSQMKCGEQGGDVSRAPSRGKSRFLGSR